MIEIIKNEIEKGMRPGGVRAYKTVADRRRARASLIKIGFNHFVFFLDTQGRKQGCDFALMFGVSGLHPLNGGDSYTCY